MDYKKYQTENDEIDLKEAFWKILLSWRALILWALIMGIVLGAIGYVKGVKDYNNNISHNEKSISMSGMDKSEIEIPEDLTAAEIREAEYLVEQYRQMEEQKAYYENDIYKQLDGYNLKTLYLQFYINVDDSALSQMEQTAVDMNYQRQMLTNDLAGMYARIFVDDEIINGLIESTGIEIDIQQIKKIYSFGKESMGNTLYFSLMLTENMNTEAVSAYIKNVINVQSKVLNKEIPHTVEVTQESIGTSYSQSVIDSQNAIIKNIYNMEKDLAEKRDKITDAQETYLFQLLSIHENGNVAERAIDQTGLEIPKPGISIKYVLIGVILGIVCVCGLVVVSVALSPKLAREEQLADQYGIKKFGVVELTKKKKGFGRGIDQWLLGIRDRQKKKRSYEEQMEAVVTGILLSCQQKDVKKLAITGTEIEHMDDSVMQEITKKLSENQIETEIVKDIYYDAAALKRCVELGTAVIVEQIGVSIGNEICNELVKADEFGIEIAGYIVIK